MDSKTQRTIESFIRLKEGWMERFCGKHKNSIYQQLLDLTWYLTVFHVINESRKFSQYAGGTYENNSMLHNFIDKCFYEYSCIALRRLLDKDSGKTTCSLFRLIADMENNHHLITRKVFFEAYGHEYDVKKVQEEHEKYFRDQKAKGNVTVTIPHRLCWEALERRHFVFDKLSGVDKASRNPSDCVRKDVLEKIIDKLNSYEDIILHTHKFVAHLATPLDQKKDSVDEVDLTYGRILEAHETICKIATFIGRYFLEFPGPFLGTVTFNQFENIDLPFVRSEHIKELNSIWGNYSRKLDSWAYIDIEDYDDLVKIVE